MPYVDHLPDLLAFVLPALLVLRAFQLSKRSKGWYSLAISGVLYTFGSLWLVTSVMSVLQGSEALQARREIMVSAGLPLFAAFLLCAEALYWLPGLSTKLWQKWTALRARRRGLKKKPAKSR